MREGVEINDREDFSSPSRSRFIIIILKNIIIIYYCYYADIQSISRAKYLISLKSKSYMVIAFCGKMCESQVLPNYPQMLRILCFGNS